MITKIPIISDIDIEYDSNTQQISYDSNQKSEEIVNKFNGNHLIAISMTVLIVSGVY